MFSYSKPHSHLRSQTLRLGTFNMEWLGDGVDDNTPRSNSEMRQIAKFLLSTNLDIIAVQEIENDEAIKRVVSNMPGYRFIISSQKNKQRVGFVYRGGVSVKKVNEYTPLSLSGTLRNGLIVKIRKGNCSFYAMSVHLKSSSVYDDTKKKQEEARNKRYMQCCILSQWTDSMMRAGHKRLVILGDFNDTPIRKKNPTLTPLITNPNLTILTERMKSCRYPNIYSIDHIIVSEEMLQFIEPNSEFVFNIQAVHSKKKLSDHCPVGITINIAKDSPNGK